MIKWLLRRRLAAFERAWNYDASYMHEVLDADPSALMAFSKVASLGRYHKDAPLAAYHAVRIVGTMAEDCGPCTQLTVDMAVRAGVDPAVLRAVVSREFSAMPADVSLAVRFAEASLRHAPEADDLRKEVVRRWGKRALISLAFAITGARIFPTVKYALVEGSSPPIFDLSPDVEYNVTYGTFVGNVYFIRFTAPAQVGTCWSGTLLVTLYDQALCGPGGASYCSTEAYVRGGACRE